jgi:hypothetical protein
MDPDPDSDPDSDADPAIFVIDLPKMPTKTILLKSHKAVGIMVFLTFFAW